MNGTIVGYLPPGEDADDFAMWHAMHDDGDDEDLEEQEVLDGIRLFEQWTDAGAPPSETVAPEGDAKSSRADVLAATTDVSTSAKNTKAAVGQKPCKMSMSALVLDGTSTQKRKKVESDNATEAGAESSPKLTKRKRKASPAMPKAG